VEAILKIIAQGFVRHKNSYLKNPWNVLDFLVLLNIILDLINFDALYQLNVLRILRVLRPIRTIKRIPSIKLLVSVILKTLPDMFNTLLFLMFFFIVFGIIGIQTNSQILYQRCRLT
jgi:hypothetical protein